MCTKGEVTVFECRIGKKKVSACAGGVGSSSKFVQYRYGAERKTELKLPKNSHVRNSFVNFSRAIYSGGGETQIRFSRGEYSYIIYDRVQRSNFSIGKGNDPKFDSGIIIVKGKTVLSNRQCNVGKITSNMDIAEKLLPKGEILIH
jgi:hypothetical protein